MHFEAYWLFPDGKIHPVTTTHIQAVINCPEEFGETSTTLKNLYDAYQENMPHEGKARVEIMKRILQRGYVRIREKQNYWVIELFQFSSKEEDLISQWVNYVRSNLTDRHAGLKINTLRDNGTIMVPLKNFL